MSDNTTNLAIVLSAQDKASAIFGGVADKLKSLGLVGGDSAKQIETMGASSEGASKKMQTMGAIAAGAVAVGIIAIGAASVKAAAQFQTMTTTLVTSAGESKENLAAVQKGIMQVSDTTGTSVENLSKAMYTIESAGHHGADGLIVLKAAAQGAKAENADVGTVADAVSSILQDYHLKAKDAAGVTSTLITAISQGKTTFQEFSGSLSAVLPVASAAHISLANITAAIASMTVHGMSAQQASENLADAIRHLQNPTQQMTAYLAQLGINSQDLSTKMADPKVGVTGAMQQISEAIMNHMGPEGKVLVSSFNQSKVAAADAAEMMGKLPKSLQDVAKEYVTGKMSVMDYRKEIKALPTDQANLLQQFVSLQNRASGFNNMLKSGQPAAKTYAAALQSATGDASSFNTALMLTGENTDYVNNAFKTISKATVEAGGNVKGWSEIQGTFNAKMDMARNSIHNTGIAIGTALLPVVTSLLQIMLKVITPVVEFIENHQKLSVIILGSIGAFASLVAVLLTLELVSNKVRESQLIMAVVSKAAAAATYIMTAAQWALNIAMDANPIGLIIIAIAALIGIVVLLYMHFTPVREFFNHLWDDIEKIFHSKIALILAVLMPFFAIPIMLIRYWHPIKDFFVALWKDLSTAFDHGGKLILLILAPFLALPLLIVTKWRAIISFFRELFTDPLQAFHTFVAGITNAWDSLVNDAKWWASKLWRGIEDGFASLGKQAVQLGKDLVSYFKEGWDDAVKNVSTWPKALWDGIVGGLGYINDLANRAGRDLVYYLGKGWTNAVTMVQNFPGDIMNALRKGIDKLSNDFQGLSKDIIRDIKKGWDNTMDEVKTWPQSIVKNIKTGMVDSAKEANSIGVKLGNDIKAGWDSATKKAEEWGKTTTKNIAKGLSGGSSKESTKDTNAISKSTGLDSLMGKGGIGGAIGGGMKQVIQFDLDTMINWKTSTVRAYQSAFKTGKELIKRIKEGIVGDWQTLDKAGSDAFGRVEKGFKAGVKNLPKTGKEFVKGIKNGIVGAWQELDKAGRESFGKIEGGFKDGFKDLPKTGKRIIKDIVSGMKETWHEITDFFKNLPKSLEPHLKKSGEETADKHVDGIKGSFADVKKMKKLGEAILKGFLLAVALVIGSILIFFISVGIAIISAIIKGIGAAIGGIGEAIGKIGGWVTGAVAGAGKWLFQTGKDIIDGLIGGIEEAVKKIGKAMGKVNGAIGGAVKGALHDIHIPGFAGGVQNFSGGLAIVGENGPELVNLPTGSSVIPAHATQQMLYQGPATASSTTTSNNSATHVTINVNVGAYAGQPGEIDKLGQVMWQSFQRIARQHGKANSLPNIGVRPS